MIGVRAHLYLAGAMYDNPRQFWGKRLEPLQTAILCAGELTIAEWRASDGSRAPRGWFCLSCGREVKNVVWVPLEDNVVAFETPANWP